MDNTERLVDAYLSSLGLGTVVFEPDGNVPPDFLVDDRIAVEARRLNQNFILRSGEVRGLEEDLFPLWQRVERFVTTIGPSQPAESWYVNLDFRRPLDSWSVIGPELRGALEGFAAQKDRQPTSIRLTKTVEIDLMRAGKVYDSMFRLGAGSDGDSGGFVLAEIHKNLKLVSTEKEAKVARHRIKYEEWWLVLADHIGFGLSPEDQETFRDLPKIEHSWNKVVLLDPRKATRAFEV